jgi:hypothetical protein
MQIRLVLILVFFFRLLPACAIHKPCSDAGDTTWNPKITGDKRCAQEVGPDGKWVNHGPFMQIYQSNREIALEGQFEMGLKDGIWIFYGEDRGLKAVKFFEKGVEKTPTAEVQKEIDRIIQQKTGVKR